MSVLSKPLPADHYLTIFSRVSLPTFLRLPLVCTTWATFQPTSGRGIHTLTLRIIEKTVFSPETESIIAKSEFTRSWPILGLSLSTLIIPHANGTLPQAIAHSLISLFPSIRSLILENLAFMFFNEDLPPEDRVSPLNTLLKSWSLSLHRLALYGFDFDPPEQTPPYLSDGIWNLDNSEALCSLLAHINTLPHLRHLLIDISNHFLSDEKFYHLLYSWIPITLRLSILRRLESFSFKSFDEMDILLPSLHHYATREPGRVSLSEIRLGSLSGALLSTLIAQGSPLLDSITHADAHYSGALSPADTRLIGAPLRNLTNFMLIISRLNRVTLRSLFRSLAKCTQLCTLNFHMSHLDSEPQESEALAEITPLVSLSSLHLYFGYPSSHTFLTTELPISQYFPALKRFKLNCIPERCTDCEFTHGHINSFTDEQRVAKQKCIRSSLAPLKACPQLETISVRDFAYLNFKMNDGKTVWEKVNLDELFGP